MDESFTECRLTEISRTMDKSEEPEGRGDNRKSRQRERCASFCVNFNFVSHTKMPLSFISVFIGALVFGSLNVSGK